MKKFFSTEKTAFFCAFFFFTLPALLSAQVTADDSRPFGQGQVIDLPGTTDYLDDLPHEITIVNDLIPYHTISGFSAEQVGWMDSSRVFEYGPDHPGAGLFFDDIPYPFPSTAILNWMPAAGSFELLDFPAQAWWGPSASLGAIQLLAPVLSNKPEYSGSVGGGSGGFWGGVGEYQNQNFSISGNYQHGIMSDLNSYDAFSGLARMDWVKDDSLKLESGFLGSQRLSNDSWYSFFTSIRLDSPNFQSIQIKPFFQSAKWGTQDVREIGTHVQYQFNMAGLIESHLLAGWSRDYSISSPATGETNLNKEFLQNSELFDALGFINGDMAFRWDFSGDSKTLFSTLLGMEGNLGDWFLLGDYANGTDETSLENTQQFDFGVRCQPDDIWNLSCKYIHEQMGMVLWDGARVKLQLNHDSRLLIVFKKMKFEIAEEPLREQGGAWTNDVGGTVEFSFSSEDHFWFKGRGLSGQPFYSETGMDYSLKENLKVFVSVANLGNLPLSWPDPSSLEGRVFWFGIQCKNP